MPYTDYNWTFGIMIMHTDFEVIENQLKNQISEHVVIIPSV